jgi:hypothetical protein
MAQFRGFCGSRCVGEGSGEARETRIEVSQAVKSLWGVNAPAELGEEKTGSRVAAALRCRNADDGGAVAWWLEYVRADHQRRAAQRDRDTRFVTAAARVPAPFGRGRATTGSMATASTFIHPAATADAVALTLDERDIEKLAQTGWLDWLLAA